MMYDTADSQVQTTLSSEVEAAIDHLDTYGYCILEGLISETVTSDMTKTFLEMHDDQSLKDQIVGEGKYQTLFGMMNRDDRVWECAAHPDVLAIARHFLGQRIKIADACSKPTWPGAENGNLHTDDGVLFHQLPDIPWLINSMWMLTDFTEDNGATGMVPLSHRSGLKVPPSRYQEDSSLVKAITGKRGSVAMWHGGMFHQARANISDQIRLGLNIAYYPIWWNNWIEGGHQPIWPETFDRMPPELQKLCPGKLAKRREDVYDVIR